MQNYNLWRKLDISQFRGRMGIIWHNTKWVKSGIEKGNNEKTQKSLETLDDCCRQLTKRIKSIDISLYNKSFPLDTLKYLQNQGIRALETIPKLTRKAMDGNEDWDEVISYTLKEMIKFEEVGDVFGRNPQYLQYRKEINGQGRI